MHLAIRRISRKSGRDRRLNAIRRLAPPDRLLCLTRAFTHLRALEDDGLWLELIQLASSEPPFPPSPPIEWLRNRLGLPFLDLTPIREESLDLIAHRWDRLPPYLVGLARAIEGAAWSERAARLVAEQDRTPDPERPLQGLYELVKEGDDPAAWSALVRLATLAQDVGELADAKIQHVAKASLPLIRASIAEGDTPGDADQFSEQGLARPDRAIGLAAAIASCFDRRPAKVRRGTAWAAIALLESIPHTSPHFARLGACMLLPDATPARAMAGVLRWDREPLFRRAALRWCGVDALGAACLERLNAAPTTADHQLVLQAIHLALRPSRASRLSMLAPSLDRLTGTLPARGPVPTALHIEELTPDAKRMIPHLLAALKPSEDFVSAAIDPLLTDPDPLVRLSALSAARPSEARDLCFDDHPSVATSAALQWSRAGLGVNRRGMISAEIERVLRSLRASPHATVRRVASEDLAGTEIWWPDLPASRLAARCTLGMEPERFNELLQQAVQGPDVGLSVRAIRMAERLRATDAIRSVLHPSAQRAASGAGPSLDPRILATIARALGCLSDPHAIITLLDLVRAPLGPGDPRIRANAVDALISHGPPTVDRDRVIDAMLELKGSSDHRVRGGVARGLARLADLSEVCAPEALDTARAMLADGRPAHRLAALWAIEHAAAPILRAADASGTLRNLEEHIVALARERDPATDARAMKVLKRIADADRDSARDHGRGGSA